MLDNMIREISARWGLADQGRPLVQMLVAHIQNPATGGLSGFLDKFRAAGWGGMVNSWLGSNATPEVPTTAQVESVLGASGDGFLHKVSSRLGLSSDKVMAAVAGILPMLIGRMTPGGTIGTQLPTEFDGFLREGQALLGLGAGAAAAGTAARYGTAHTSTRPAAAAAAVPPASSSGFGKWLPWLIAALVVIFGVSYCSKDKTPTAETTPAPASVPATPAANDPVPQPPVAEPSAASVVPGSTAAVGSSTGSASDMNASGTADMAGANGDAASNGDTLQNSSNTQSGSDAHSTSQAATTANYTVPDGADVIDDMHNGMPVLRVFFDTGKTEVATAFADKSKSLVEFLKANPDVTAVISGFNDPTGDPARNAELSKQRAQAVKSALEAAGVAPDRAVLEKPAETTDTGATNAQSRRVDVMLRR